MKKVLTRRCMIPAALLAALGLVFTAGCSKDLMSPDEQPPTGSMITNPIDATSLNTSVISVRGRAEVGATIDVFVNDVFEGSGVSSPAVPNDGLGGRYTVEDVELGEEGVKVLRARVTDLYGNVSSASETPTITITLDQTEPPIEFLGIEGAAWHDSLGYWESGLPEIIVSGRTDTSAAGARLRVGINEHPAQELVEVPGTDSLRFSIDVSSPPLSGGNADTLITYYLEAFDEADNVGFVPVVVHWAVEGRELTKCHDDGEYDSWDHTITGSPGQRVAVRYQAPTWANYVTKFIFYSANDQQDNPVDPQLPTTMPFTAWVWRCTTDSLPGNAGNDGYMPFTEPYMYPEDEWVTVTFPNAVDITNNDHYPNKTFFVGLEWEHRLSPYIYEDHLSATNEIDFKSFRWNWSTWELRNQADTMICAVVSDVPTMGDGREAIIYCTSSQ
jgi:hypothetical protein